MYAGGIICPNVELAFSRINAAETALVIVIVFVAAFMARGAWI